ncbi:unnamed protein product [Oikopleura dioica]|uniref:Phospholipase A2 domain-containing protein n=1 Tax=Oikopleura dioica TaxID=34765 RepID=E4YJ39_OIKDI|nr:unnamed protein product [Oikopleura dioica]
MSLLGAYQKRSGWLRPPTNSSALADDACYRNGQEVDCTVDDTDISPRFGSSKFANQIVTEEDRRYADLKAIAQKLWQVKGAEKFDERKYWAYGCHCFLLGDRPMSEMGIGAPKDQIDTRCRAYKQCNKCVRREHGDDCIGERVQYTWRYKASTGSFSSLNKVGSCERDLFECDHQFVQDLFQMKDEFDESYHYFWGSPPFDNRKPANCPKKGGIPVEHECCGGGDKAFKWIGLNKFQCCPDGTVKPNILDC